MQVEQYIGRLADGAWHQIDNPADCRAQLAEVGLTVAVDGERCRLRYPLDLYDPANLALPDGVQLDTAGVVDSTSTRLLQRGAPPDGICYALLAEYQSSGRGRHGRTWVSPYGGGLCLSLSRLFARAPAEPGTLSLAIGVAVLRALRQFGVFSAGLKWPNDVLCSGNKLGGVLIEATQKGQALHVVTGIGINVRLAPEAAAGIIADGGVSVTDLHTINPAQSARRNELAAALIASGVAAMQEYEKNGFAPFSKEWNDADVLHGCAVQVSGGVSIAGIASGIDATGALIVQAGTQTHRLTSGDVRVRSV